MRVQTRRRIDMAWWTSSSCENHAAHFYGNWACDPVAGRRSWAVVAATTGDTLRQHHDRSRGCRRSLLWSLRFWHCESALASNAMQRARLQILVLDVDPDAEHDYDRLLEATTFYRTTLTHAGLCLKHTRSLLTSKALAVTFANIPGRNRCKLHSFFSRASCNKSHHSGSSSTCNLIIDMSDGVTGTDPGMRACGRPGEAAWLARVRRIAEVRGLSIAHWSTLGSWRPCAACPGHTASFPVPWRETSAGKSAVAIQLLLSCDGRRLGGRCALPLLCRCSTKTWFWGDGWRYSYECSMPCLSVVTVLTSFGSHKLRWVLFFIFGRGAFLPGVAHWRYFLFFFRFVLLQ